MRCAGFRGWRQEVEGWGDGVIVSESMQIRCPHENGRAVFLDFSTLRPVFKKVCFQALRFQDPCGRSAKTTQYMYVFTKERFSCRRPLRWSAHKAAVALPTDAKVFLLHFFLHGMGVKRRRTVILHTCEGFLKKKKKALITTEVLSQWGNLKKKKRPGFHQNSYHTSWEDPSLLLYLVGFRLLGPKVSVYVIYDNRSNICQVVSVRTKAVHRPEPLVLVQDCFFNRSRCRFKR